MAQPDSTSRGWWPAHATDLPSMRAQWLYHALSMVPCGLGSRCRRRCDAARASWIGHGRANGRACSVQQLHAQATIREKWNQAGPRPPTAPSVPAWVGMVPQHVKAHAARLGTRGAGALAQHALALRDALRLHVELRDDHQARRRHARRRHARRRQAPRRCASLNAPRRRQDDRQDRQCGAPLFNSFLRLTARSNYFSVKLP